MIRQHRSAAPPVAATARAALFLGAAGADGGPDEAVVTRALLEAWSSGIRTHAVGRPAGAGPATRVLWDAVADIDATHPESCVRWAREQVARGGRFDLVLGLSDDVQPAAAATARALGLPGNPPGAVATVQDLGARLAALAAGGFLVECPEQATAGTPLAVVGAFLSGRPQVFLVAAAAPGGWRPAGELSQASQVAVADEAAAAVRHLGLRFGLFRVDLRIAEHGIVVNDVRLTLGDGSLPALLERTVPCLELYNLVYDEALNRSVPPPVRDLAPRQEAPAARRRRYVFPEEPILLAGDPDDPTAEPNIWRGID